MRILVISPYAKNIAPSMRYRIEQWMPRLRGEGIEFDYIAFSDRRLHDLLLEKGKVFRKAFLLFVRLFITIWKVLRSNRPDLVFVHREATRVGPPLIERYIRMRGIPIIYDFDDPIFLPASGSKSGLWNILKFPNKTRGICKLSSYVTVGNQNLADYAEKYNSDVRVIPSTIDTGIYYPKEHISKRIPTLGWTGSHSTAEVCLPLLSSVLLKLKEKLDFKMMVICSADTDIDIGVEYELVEWNADSECDDLERIDIGVMPLADDPWQRSKCGFKLLQYMGMGIPAIASPVGVNCDIIRDGVNGFLAKNEDEWISKIMMLGRDADLRRKVGFQGRKTVEEKYSANVAAKKLINILEDLNNREKNDI